MATRLAFLKPGAIAAVAAVALTACAGGVTVTRQHIAQNYDPDELYIVGTGENELRTVVVGDPYGMPRAAFETAVLKSLQGRNFGPRLNLSVAPTHEDKRKRHVVIAFNPAAASTAKDLCSGTADTTPATETLTVTGVYCSGEYFLTRATARAGGIRGPDTPQFHALMTQLAIALFPDENPHRQLDGDCTVNC